MNKRQFIVDNFYGQIMFLDGLDEAIIGTTTRDNCETVVVYDRKKVIDILAKTMSEEEAEEFFEYNVEAVKSTNDDSQDISPIFIEVL